MTYHLVYQGYPLSFQTRLVYSYCFPFLQMGCISHVTFSLVNLSLDLAFWLALGFLAVFTSDTVSFRYREKNEIAQLSD